jgi:hypothetical protein
MPCDPIVSWGGTCHNREDVPSHTAARHSLLQRHLLTVQERAMALATEERCWKLARLVALPLIEAADDVQRDSCRAQHLAECLHGLCKHFPHALGIGTGVGRHVARCQITPDRDVVNTASGHQAHFFAQ